MTAWIGKSLIGIGVIHSLFGFVFMRSTLRVLWGEGLFNTVSGQPPREAVFWFLYTGFLLLVIGVLVDYLEKTGLRIPAFVTWFFLMLTIAGAVVMPFSGIWLLLPPVVGMLARERTFEKAQP